MKCNELNLYKQGALGETAWREHAAHCPACREELQLQEALQAALVPAAAPAALVERVFAQTTRRKSWWVRWRLVLAGGLAAVLAAAGLVYNLSHPTPFTPAELVSYMNVSQESEYRAFLSDLDTFEQEF